MNGKNHRLATRIITTFFAVILFFAFSAPFVSGGVVSVASSERLDFTGGFQKDSLNKHDSLKSEAAKLDTTVKNDTKQSTDTVNVREAKALSPQDSLRLFYKFSFTPPIFSSPYSVRDSTRDFLYHRHVEDFFAELPQFYLRDKSEFGQLNELLVGGLGTRYQHILLDEILLNDPITGIAPYNYLSSESFSDLELYFGYKSLGSSSAPVTIESQTQRLTAFKGYVKARYFQFAGTTTKFDVTFSLNLSPRLNIYLGYKYEGTDGLYRNQSVFGNERFASNSLSNYIRGRLRYQFSERTFLTLALENNTASMLPFGGVDFDRSLSGFDSRFDARNATVLNQYSRRDLFMQTFKGEFQTALPFLQDSLSVFRAWSYLSRFQTDFQRTRADSLLLPFSDTESSTRLALGAKQSLKIFFLSLQAKAALTSDRITAQNTLRNSAGDTTFLPFVNTLNLNASGKIRLEKILFGQDLELGGSTALTTMFVSGTGGDDYNTSFVSNGFGGDVAFPLPIKNSSIAGFANVSFTSRVPTLREVFSRDSLLSGSLTWQNELVRQAEVGGALTLDSIFYARLSLMNNQVFSPMTVIQTQAFGRGLSFSTNARFRSLDNNTLTYTAVGISLKLHVWKLDGIFDGTVVLAYNILSNQPDNPYNEGFRPTLFTDGRFLDSLSTNRLFYLPRLYGSYGVFFRDKLFRGALDLKVGFAGFFSTDFSASLRNRERQQIFYFNIIEQNGVLRDVNLQSGVNLFQARVDFQAWAKIGSATAFFMWENLLDQVIFRVPFFSLQQRGIRFGVSWEILN